MLFDKYCSSCVLNVDVNWVCESNFPNPFDSQNRNPKSIIQNLISLFIWLFLSHYFALYFMKKKKKNCSCPLNTMNVYINIARCVCLRTRLLTTNWGEHTAMIETWRSEYTWLYVFGFGVYRSKVTNIEPCKAQF